MHILCTICSDLVNQAENIYVTKCGHIFHLHCLSQWIERSRSCPHCRRQVTDKCIFRVFPTVSNENETEDVATLQSRLDDALLQLRQGTAANKEKDERLALAIANVTKNEELIKACEKKLVNRESAVAALKEQLEYVKVENKELQKTKEENEILKKSIQTLNGLQKVLNATSAEVEEMLVGYTDVRTVGTFAAALKRALTESESKRKEVRDRLQTATQQLAAEKLVSVDLRAALSQLQEKLTTVERKYENLKSKRKSGSELEQPAEGGGRGKRARASPRRDVLNDAVLSTRGYSDISITSIVNKIEASSSPYLRLKAAPPALAALPRAPLAPTTLAPPTTTLAPSEFKFLNCPQTQVKRLGTENKPTKEVLSIFQSKPSGLQPTEKRAASDQELYYDGLGGHSRPDTFPHPCARPPLKACLPRITAKHKLKRPISAGSQDIRKMLESINDK